MSIRIPHSTYSTVSDWRHVVLNGCCNVSDAGVGTSFPLSNCRWGAQMRIAEDRQHVSDSLDT